MLDYLLNALLRHTKHLTQFYIGKMLVFAQFTNQIVALFISQFGHIPIV